MDLRRWACLLSIGLVVPALAGCADEAPAAQPLDRGSTNDATIDRPFEPAPPPTKRPSERWHFHDHWKGQPHLELLNRTVELNATQDHAGVPAVAALVEFDPGVVVPPETGMLTVHVSWEDAVQGAINLTYRPADANGFFPAADVENGANATIAVTESMADVPHRGASLWAFNLTAKPGGTPPTLPPREVHVRIVATIGRPLFIDSPHIDWWQGSDARPLVMGHEGSLDAARTPVANVSLPGSPTSVQPRPADHTRPATVPVDEGSIVPEGTKSVVVLLNWSSDIPDRKLVVHYRESNLPSSGPMNVAKDGATNRIFVIPVDPDQTDTSYSNRTTWEFHVLPEKDTDAFHGTFTMYAWVTRLAPDEAVRETVGVG